MTEFEIPKTPYFDLTATLECGQVFRFTRDEDCCVIKAGRHIARVYELEDSYRVVCDDKDFFWRYFDFDTDYALVQSKVSDEAQVAEAIEFGKGIHILRQDPAETIFSFLISQNNNIPRIKSIIERLSDGLGEDMGDYRAFPTVEAMAGAGKAYFLSIGAGYRADYLDKTANALLEADLDEWAALDTDSLRARLMSLHGVGRKVADCILLFGFSRFDVFPVDTWIKKVFESAYPGMPADKMSVLLVEKYGKYAGFVQQWLFYYKREKKV